MIDRRGGNLEMSRDRQAVAGGWPTGFRRRTPGNSNEVRNELLSCHLHQIFWRGKFIELRNRKTIQRLVTVAKGRNEKVDQKVETKWLVGSREKVEVNWGGAVNRRPVRGKDIDSLSRAAGCTTGGRS